MPAVGSLESRVRRDRIAILCVLTTVVVICAAYILAGAGMGMSVSEMTRVHGAAAMDRAQWSLGYAGIMLVMWWVMMAAMMLPSAAPMILMFAAMSRRRGDGERTVVSSAVFVAGYLIVWGGFSIAAVLAQWGLEASRVLSPVLASSDAVLGAVLLLAAGLYQLTPLKQACLRHCRSPLGFVMTRWRGGTRGALRMGIEHGAYCMGCCWFLMGLLFFGGVMNLYWIAGIAAYVLLEKTVPAGHWLGYAVGAGLTVWGIAALLGTA